MLRKRRGSWLRFLIVLSVFGVIAMSVGLFMDQQVRAEMAAKWKQVRASQVEVRPLYVMSMEQQTARHNVKVWYIRLGNEENHRVTARQDMNSNPGLKIGDAIPAYHLGEGDYFIPRFDDKTPPRWGDWMFIAVGVTPLGILAVVMGRRWGKFASQ